MSLTLAFHTNQICLQGTEVALYDYAHFNESLLGNKSLIISRHNPIRKSGGAGKNQPLALEKFRSRFPLVLYKDLSELDRILNNHKVDALYAIKKGVQDGVESKNVRTLIHAVFKYHEPHGDIYAYVSKWLADLMTSGKAPYVPHMINIPKSSGDLRESLGIPKEATVLARYGGTNSFDIEFVHRTVEDYARRHPEVYFLFMNTDDFLNSQRSFTSKLFRPKTQLPNVIFLEPSSSLDYKYQFINSSDAMLHGRLRGETFGIAIGEFSIHNKPVLTYGGLGQEGFESNHIEILGNKAWVYNDSAELEKLIDEVHQQKKSIPDGVWDAYSQEYSPEVVMEKFKKVFLS